MYITNTINVSWDGFAVEKELLSDDHLESFTINKMIIYSLNLLSFLGLGYLTMVLILNADNLDLLYETIPIEVYQSILTVILIVTIYINTKLIRKFHSDWKPLIILTIVYIFFTLLQAVILYQNPTTMNFVSLSIPGIITQPKFWMILFYPLMIVFYIIPIIVLIQENKSMEENIKTSLILFLSSFGIMLFTQCSKAWNTTGWTIPMISFSAQIEFLNDVEMIVALTNFKISTFGFIGIFLSMIFFIGGVVFLFRDIQEEPNSIYTLIPYIVLILIIVSDYIFSDFPANIKFFNTFIIVIWLLIGIVYTIAYTMIPNSILNTQLTEKSKFTPKIRSRMHDKKLEMQILDTITENKITQLIELSSFLGMPYHKVLKSLKNLILQGYMSGRIVNQQFIHAEGLHSYESSQQLPEFPSPFEIWKISMINEGVISIEDLSAIMSVEIKDLELSLIKISVSLPEKNNLIDGFIYITTLNELESLYSEILVNLPKPENSLPLNTNSGTLSE